MWRCGPTTAPPLHTAGGDPAAPAAAARLAGISVAWPLHVHCRLPAYHTRTVPFQNALQFQSCQYALQMHLCHATIKLPPRRLGSRFKTVSWRWARRFLLFFARAHSLLCQLSQTACSLYSAASSPRTGCPAARPAAACIQDLTVAGTCCRHPTVARRLARPPPASIVPLYITTDHSALPPLYWTPMQSRFNSMESQMDRQGDLTQVLLTLHCLCAALLDHLCPARRPLHSTCFGSKVLHAAIRSRCLSVAWPLCVPPAGVLHTATPHRTQPQTCHAMPNNRRADALRQPEG